MAAVRADTHRANNHREGRQDKQDRHDNRMERRMGMGMDRTRQTHGHMDKDMDGWTVTDIQRHDRQTTDIQTSDLRQRRQ